MSRNLVLCADGTGNLGGETPDTNVYTLYNAIDLQFTDPVHYTYYDNGVGTSDNKIWRALSGGLGFGFKKNVVSLYEFLAKNYEPEDKVFFFGFSRGAAEVRALSGFIAASGLVDGRELSRDDLQARIKEAFEVYKSASTDAELAKRFRETQKPGESFGVIPITFIGVWDTVSALGFPQDWKAPGSIGMWLFNLLFKSLDILSDRGRWAHRFYNYELTTNIQVACQALAIDDERKSFAPLVWDENLLVDIDGKGKKPIGHLTNIEQVWFAGSHSNVGGGYGRAGMANVTLEWMMTRAQDQGLKFKDYAQGKVQRNANVHDRLYDSRDGVAYYYRFHPRMIEELCWNKKCGQSKLQKLIQIHRSVFERMKRRTRDYAPGYFPQNLDMVATDRNIGPMKVATELDEGVWRTHIGKVDKRVSWRKKIHGAFLECNLLGFLSVLYLLSPRLKGETVFSYPGNTFGLSDVWNWIIAPLDIIWNSNPFGLWDFMVSIFLYILNFLVPFSFIFIPCYVVFFSSWVLNEKISRMHSLSPVKRSAIR